MIFKKLQTFKPWQSFPLMLSLGFLLGLATGGYPPLASQIATASLIVAMSLALTEIHFTNMKWQSEIKSFLIALILNYLILSGLILILAFFTKDYDFRAGWIIMAAVPPAIAVIPLTSILKGNVRTNLVSSALIYLSSLVLIPMITLAFVGKAISPTTVIIQTFLMIGFPLLISRILIQAPKINNWRPIGVNLAFFVLATMVVGINRSTFADLEVLRNLSSLAILRTSGIGLIVYAFSIRMKMDYESRVSWVLFTSLKNLGLATLLSFSLFGPRASVPVIVAALFETLWIVTLHRLFRKQVKTIEDI